MNTSCPKFQATDSKDTVEWLTYVKTVWSGSSCWFNRDMKLCCHCFQFFVTIWCMTSWLGYGSLSLRLIFRAQNYAPLTALNAYGGGRQSTGADIDQREPLPFWTGNPSLYSHSPVSGCLTLFDLVLSTRNIIVSLESP